MNTELIIDKIDIEKCTESSGVYWLYQKNYNGWNVVYVGISNNIKRRLREHSLMKDFDGFFFETVDYRMARDKEKIILNNYKLFKGTLPLLNKQT